MNTFKIVSLLVCIFFTCFTSIYAQTKIWGTGASIGNVEGEFQNAFITTGTAGSYALTSWTALSVYENGGVIPGNAYWSRNILGYSQGAYTLSLNPIPSPTQNNGVAIFDSDYLDNNGTVGAFGSGTSPASHRGELISPNIDLSGYTDSSIMVQFFSQYRVDQIEELSVSMSIDSGLTWSPAIDYRQLQNSNDAGWVRVYFPTLTTGVSGLTHCRLRFTFEGNYYYAMIDDVSIGTAPKYDIAIARPNPNSFVLEERGDYVKIGNNRYISPNNLEGYLGIPFYDLNQWIFGLRAVNYGIKDLLPSDSARIRLEIDFVDYLNTFYPSVYSDTIYFSSDTLKAEQQNSIVGLEQLRDVQFILGREGDFVAKYWVEHRNQDAFSDNDTITHVFSVGVSGGFLNRPPKYLSKARLDTNDSKVQATSAFFPPSVDSSTRMIELGSMFYFPEGQFSYNVNIDAVDFKCYIPPNYTGDTTVNILVNIHEFEDNTPFDGLVNSSELVAKWVGVVTLTGIGTTHPVNSYVFGKVTSFFDIGTGLPMPNPTFDENNGGFYIIGISQQPYVFGGASIIDSNNVLWFGIDEYNYTLNTLASNGTTTIPQASILRLVDTTGNHTLSLHGENFEVIPSIGIHTSDTSFVSTSTLSIPQKEMNASIYPNPANDILNVSISFEEPTDVQYIITSVLGTVLYIKKGINIRKEKQVFNTKNLPAGTYYLTIKSNKGEWTEGFIRE